MGKLSGKKLLLLGERDGVPGPAMADVFANSGAEVLFSATEASSERPRSHGSGKSAARQGRR